MDAVVTDAFDRGPLAGLRGLGRAGLAVAALAPRWSGAGLWSRHTSRRLVAPDPALDPNRFAEAIADLARRQGPLVVYPGREEAIDALLEARALPSEVVLPYPRLDALERIRDKRILPSLAADAGLATPLTHAEGRARDLIEAEVPLPCLVKSAVGKGALQAARRVDSSPALRSLLESLPAQAPLVLQEWIDGPLAAIALVVAPDGGVVACFQQVSRRIWPRDAGTSAVAISVELDGGLAEAARRVLAGAGYAGLAQLQFILSERGPRLIDVNPRFYGSLPLALAAGVNLPAAWHSVARGDSAPRPASYRVGVSFHCLQADVTAAWHGTPIGQLRRPAKPRTGAVWARDDPLPSTMLGVSGIAGMVGRRLPLPRAAA